MGRQGIVLEILMGGWGNQTCKEDICYEKNNKWESTLEIPLMMASLLRKVTIFTPYLL